MYHGNIFQDAPTFPFATKKEQVGTWGVETEFENVFLCGSSAAAAARSAEFPGITRQRKYWKCCSQVRDNSNAIGGFTLLPSRRNATGNKLTL